MGVLPLEMLFAFMPSRWHGLHGCVGYTNKSVDTSVHVSEVSTDLFLLFVCVLGFVHSGAGCRVIICHAIPGGRYPRARFAAGDPPLLYDSCSPAVSPTARTYCSSRNRSKSAPISSRLGTLCASRRERGTAMSEVRKFSS